MPKNRNINSIRSRMIHIFPFFMICSFLLCPQNRFNNSSKYHLLFAYILSIKRTAWRAISTHPIRILIVALKSNAMIAKRSFLLLLDNINAKDASNPYAQIAEVIGVRSMAQISSWKSIRSAKIVNSSQPLPHSWLNHRT